MKITVPLKCIALPVLQLILVLIVPRLERLKRLHVADVVQTLAVIFNHVRTQCLDIFQFNKLKHFNDSRVQQIVAAVIAHESIDNGRKQVAFDDVTIVELVLERD